MLVSLLAIGLQTAGLPADRSKAAMTCAQATATAQAGQKSPMRLTSQYSYYLIHAARADPGGKPFFERLQELAERAGKEATLTADAALPLVEPCERRFPRPSTTPVERLPADPFQRNVMCFGTLSMLQGAAQGLKDDRGDAAPLAALEAVMKPLSAKLDDAEIKRHGVADDAAFLKLLGDQLQATIALGEPAAVATACGVKDL
jgi:hypothetical protein